MSKEQEDKLQELLGEYDNNYYESVVDKMLKKTIVLEPDMIDRFTYAEMCTVVKESWGYGAMDDFPDDYEYYTENTHLLDTKFILSYQNGDIAGMCILSSSMMSNGLKELTWLAVRPKYRGARVGGLIMEKAVEESRESICTLFWCTDIPEYYEKLGYERLTNYPNLNSMFMVRYEDTDE